MHASSQLPSCIALKVLFNQIIICLLLTLKATRRVSTLRLTSLILALTVLAKTSVLIILEDQTPGSLYHFMVCGPVLHLRVGAKVLCTKGIDENIKTSTMGTVVCWVIWVNVFVVGCKCHSIWHMH